MNEASADSMEDMLAKAKQVTINHDAKDLIPGYSEIGKNEVEAHLNSVDLDNAGIQKRDQEIGAHPEGGIATASETSTRVSNNFQNLDMFERADKIMKDPLFNIHQSCRELKLEKELPYSKHEVIKVNTEVVDELRTCELPKNRFECERILKLHCEAQHDCDFGGIVRDSVASDMKLEYSGGVLTIGTIQDNYWSGNCQIYDRDTEFTIKNIDKLTEFRLIQAGFDDHIQIKVNGKVIYVGPYGGSHLELRPRSFLGTQIFNGESNHNCELGTNWNKNLDIDLKPYLKEGRNKISMRVIVSGHGEGWLKISAKQHCCSSWREEWISDCVPLS